jgi:hypothetical protein
MGLPPRYFYLLTRCQLQLHFSIEPGGASLYVTQVDDLLPVDAEKHFWIKHTFQVVQGFLDKRLVVLEINAGIIAIGFKEVDLFEMDKPAFSPSFTNT